MKRNSKIIVAIAGLAVVIAVGFVIYLTNKPQLIEEKLVTPQPAMLNQLWQDYKTGILETGTLRALDRSQDNITTSEGQSYTMMRAVWQDDQSVFDTSWEWAKSNLRRDDKLFSWKFGPRPDGTYGVQDHVGGQNTASDADIDIAFALLMAHHKWNKQQYYDEAKDLIGAIWEHEVAFAAGEPVLAANTFGKGDGEYILVNPSYFAPYAFKLFAIVDPNNDWQSLVDSSYGLLNKALTSPLDGSQTAQLPPNWMHVHKQSGVVSAVTESGLNTNHSYDAMRTAWRLALDWQWNAEPRARQVLQRMSFLSEQWQSERKINDVYTHAGDQVGSNESQAIYGGLIGYFKVIDPAAAQQIYNQKLLPLYSAQSQGWREPLGYYDDNWVWFGMALMQDALPNFAE